MDQKRLFENGNTEPARHENREEIHSDEHIRKSSPIRGMPLRTSLRASKRSLKDLGATQYTPGRTNQSKPLINTKAMRYNPAGPGDYNIPSAFGELPPVTGHSK